MSLLSVFSKTKSKKQSVATQFRDNSKDVTCDFAIIGSGFGGSVTAMRLAQKGYTVAIIEEGKRWNAADFPESNWNLPKYAWIPEMKFYGIQRISLLDNVMVLHGAGVGGGSLVYANVLMEPDANVFKSWPTSIDWKNELNPYYTEAKKMLGVATNPMIEDAEKALDKVSKEMKAEQEAKPTEVGVYFGEAGKKVNDPYFNGDGPERSGCTGCGGCMVGCKVGAKNTLDKNYLYFAEKWGAEVFAETSAVKIIPGSDGYTVTTKQSTSLLNKKGPTLHAKNVIVAAGVLGTVDLLLQNRDVYKTLPDISGQLGNNVRTNGESLVGATGFDKSKDMSKGIAIGAVFKPDDNTTIQAVKYPAGSNLIKLLSLPQIVKNADGKTSKALLGTFKKFPQLMRIWMAQDWAKQSTILLTMQKVDENMKLVLKKSPLGPKLASVAGDKPFPPSIPAAEKAAKELAKQINGEAQNVATEVLLGRPATAHILGGCVIGDDKSKGVVNSNHQVFSYPGLYVCDGSVTPTNLGINPSLTIASLSERFAAQFPVKDQDLYKKRQITYSSDTKQKKQSGGCSGCKSGGSCGGGAKPKA